MDIFEVAEIFSESETILITAGAGMGVDSGLPDFRGDDGFWRAYPPYKEMGLNLEQVAQAAAYLRDPAFAWGFAAHKQSLFSLAVPHEGYIVLLNMLKRLKKDYFVVTSNIDGHFLHAGFNKHRVWEIHGSYKLIQCSKPCCEKLWKWPKTTINVDNQSMRAEKFPLCPKCGATARPNVLMFADPSWVSKPHDVQASKYREFLSRTKPESFCVIEIGCGTSIHSLRKFGERLCYGNHGTLIRVNPDDVQSVTSTTTIQLGALKAILKISDAFTCLK